MKVVFFGTPSFAASILEFLVIDGVHDIVGVVTKPDVPRGRDLRVQHTEVRAVRDRLLPHVPLFQPEKVSTSDMANILADLKADLFLVVAYGELIKSNILSIPPYGCVNVHASLLPGYRGAAPIQRALLDGVSVTGVTIMKMDQGLDSGDVFKEYPIVVDENMNCGELTFKMLEVSRHAVLEVLAAIADGSASLTPQNHVQKTLAPKIMPEELYLDLFSLPARVLHNKIRAFSPKPGGYCYLQTRSGKKRLKVMASLVRAVPKERAMSTHTPELFLDGEGIRVALPKDPYEDLIVTRLQLEGKKEMSAREFVQGVSLAEISMTL